VVAATTLHCGVTGGRGEKTVWAFLPTTVSGTYSRTVRRAAQDAVRAVLAHGAPSPDAILAVQQLPTRLADEHGPKFVPALAAELVRELAEASYVTASLDERDRRTVEGRQLIWGPLLSRGHREVAS